MTHIIVRGTKTGLPYSKGLMARSLTATGLSPATAYRIAETLEQRLKDDGRDVITVDELRASVSEELRQRVSGEAAQRYLTWQKAQERDRPLLMLIGGATGVGKSTVAAHVGSQFGITRMVSTDIIREVMRATISRDILPWLHVSSFEAVEVGSAVPSHTTDDVDRLLVGFLRQTRVVAVGIEQLLRRAVVEETDMIVEGVHVVPGVIDLPSPKEAVVVQVVLAIEDEEVHRSHFDRRGLDAAGRPRQRYLDHFNEIRRIHGEIVDRAGQHGVPVISSYALDPTVSTLTDLLTASIVESAR